MSNEDVLKMNLIEQLSSKDGKIIRNAMYWLDQHGWITDGTLRNTKLVGADLYEADLGEADLGGANLSEACLYSAYLKDTNLENAILVNSDLHDSFIVSTNLLNANLREANLEGVVFSERTILPDGTHWTKQTDMTRFTNPNHLNFWDTRVKTGKQESDE